MANVKIFDSQQASADLKKLSDLLNELENDIISASNAALNLTKNLSSVNSLSKFTSLTKNQTTAQRNGSRAMSEYEKIMKQTAIAQEKLRLAQQGHTQALIKARTETNRLHAEMRKGFNNIKKTTSSFNSLGKSVMSLVGAFGIIGGAQMFANLVKNTFDLTKNLNALSFAMEAVIKDSFELGQTQVWLTEITDNFGAELVSTTERYIKFRAAAQQAGFTADETMKIFETMTKVSGVLGLKTDELRGVYLALEQMISKGKITTEELRRQLGERLPGAMDIMATSMGVTTAELDKMMKKGEVVTKDVLPAFADQVEKSFGIESVNKVETLQAATTRLSNSWTKLIIDLEGSEGGLSTFFTFFVGKADEVLKRWNSLNTVMGSSVSFWAKFSAIAKTPFSAEDLHTLAEEIKMNDERNMLLDEALGLLDEHADNRATNNDLDKVYNELLKLNNEQLKIWIKSMKSVASSDMDTVEGRKKVLKIQTDVNNSLFGSIFIIDTAIDMYKKMSIAATDPKMRDFALNNIKILGDLKDKLQGVSEEVPNLAVDKFIPKAKDFNLDEFIADLSNKLALPFEFVSEAINDYLDSSLNDFEEFYKKLAEISKENAELRKDIERGVFDFLSELSNSIFEVRVQKIDDEIEKNNEYYDNLYDRASNNKDEQDRIRGEQERKEKELEKRKEKEEKKRFLMDRAFAVAQIWLNHAQALTAQAVRFPPPLNAPLIPLVWANTLLSLGTVAAQTIPAFKDGTKNAPKGLAIVGDGGVHEYIEDKKGNIFQTPKTDTLVSLSGGEEIHKNLDSLANSRGFSESDIYKSTVLASLASEKGISTYRLEKVLDNSLKGLKDDLKKGIRDGFKNISLHSHNTTNFDHSIYRNNTL